MRYDTPLVVEPVAENDWGTNVTFEDYGPSDFNDNLSRASANIDYERADLLVRALIAHIRERDDEFPYEHAKTILTLLRKKRWFNLMERTADALIACGQDHPSVRRQFAQSLLDQGQVTAAVCVLSGLVADTDINGDQSDKAEFREAKGLLGRAYKQQYVESAAPHLSRNRRAVLEAIAHYREVFEQDSEQLWHGINAVALTQRALRDRVELPVREHAEDEVRSGARSIARDLQGRHDNQQATRWDYGTAVEAHVALFEISETESERRRHVAEAAKWLTHYLADPAADAFEYAATHRQLVEVWGLRPDEGPGEILLPPLTAMQLQKQGGVLIAEPRAIDSLATASEKLEKVFGSNGPVPLSWLVMGMHRARAVARIVRRDGSSHGTGFLVDGADYSEALAGENLILTNSHVVRRSAGGPKPLGARAQFESVRATEVEITDVLWDSPTHKLDASLLRFEGKLPKSARPIRQVGLMPDAEDDQPDRAYVIGHPQGRPAAMSIHDNVILDSDDRVLHYRSPTEPGSSGSPVFDTDWGLIGLHHAGSSDKAMLNENEGFYEANEAIRIDAILTTARRALASAT